MTAMGTDTGTAGRVRYYRELGSWVVADRDLAQGALGHPALSSGTLDAGSYLPADTRAQCAELLDVLGRWFVFLDGDEHTGARRAMQRLFSPGRIRRLGDEIQAIVVQALEEFPQDGTGEAVSRLAEVVSARSMARMLGLRPTDAGRLHAWAGALSDFLATSYRRDHALRAQQALREMGAYIRESADDPDSIWSLTGGDDRDRLATCSLMLFGGLETTASLMGLSLWYVLENGLAAVVRDPGESAEVEAVVERVLELFPPLGHVARTASADLEVGGCPIARGDLVLVSLTGRDPFEGQRGPARPPAHTRGGRRSDHLAFGHAMHYCMGATLARMEASLLLRLFCERYPDARVRDAVWGRNRTYRGLSRLLVELHGADAASPSPAPSPSLPLPPSSSRTGEPTNDPEQREPAQW
ncbi:cytochrome P450 [Streptomyces virginiae]|uniref:cytochrome P450 n=1 Tax=Streptomyces virginiae TaxID=1961 RepID=UPI0036E611E6